jgi:TRAP transporter 4TM/12TM fusion protein
MRELKGWSNWAIALWAAFATVFHLYTAYIGFLEPREQRSLSLLLFLPLIFVLYPARPDRSPKDQPSVVDWLLSALAIVPSAYSYVHALRINMRLEEVDPVLTEEVVMGTIAIVLVLEALRRAVTPVLAGLVGIGLGYLLLCEYMGGIWRFRDIPYSEIIETMYLINGHGIYGPITGIASTLVAVFITFGAFVEGGGIGRLFGNLGSRVAGPYAGGPAKVAVVSSGLMGMMSGSSTSNVFTTGAFTIPMMKRLGYRKSFAGAVEVSASVGGQITPPIMGTGAFIMSEMTNIPYTDIVVSAILGAFVYYLMMLISVHLEAKKHGLRGLNPDELPTWQAVAKDAHLLVPIVVLIVLLSMDFSAHFAAFYSIIATFVIAALRKHTRMGPRKVFQVLVTAGRNVAAVSIACVGAGMFVAVLIKTGLILSLGTIISSLAGGELWIVGGLLMLTCLILGMGVPTSAAYVITAAIGAPILIVDFGVPVLAAHMFVFYFAILAEATPPVSIAAYAAAGIAKANPISTGIQAFKLATAGFIIGYSYLFSQGLLLMETPADTVGEVAVILVGICLLAAGFRGYWNGIIAMPFRILLVPFGFLVVDYGDTSDLVRIAVGGSVLVLMWLLPKLFALGGVVKPLVPEVHTD